MNSDPSVPDETIKDKHDRREQGVITATKAVTVGKPREEVYAFFRRFSNLPTFMRNVERIDELDATRSHWVVKGPAGHDVEWDAVVTTDEPGRLIGWESAAGADVKNHGRVEFRDAPADRGCEIHAAISYEPPAGELGKIVAGLFGKDPGEQAHADLRQLKMLLETGEVATTQAPDAAPRYDKSKASEADRAAETR